MKHELKTDRLVFDAVFAGLKTHEIRLNDRSFTVGDELLLKETKFTGAEMNAGAPLEFTGREVTKVVSHVLTGYGLQDGWCILSFEQNQQLAAQNAELVAHNAAMKDALDEISNWNKCTSEFRINYGSNGERDFYRKVAADALSKTPTKHLRDRDAEAGRAGFVAGFIYALGDADEYDVEAAEFNGKQYAEKVRRGEV